MYEHQGIDNFLFVALYWAVAMMATLAGVYLLATRGNAFTREVKMPPRALRRWAAAFMATVVGSHVWWAVPVEAWAGKTIRDMACISLDLLTLVPLMMAWLLRLLQDRRRRVWPWLVAHVPMAVLAVVAVWQGDASGLMVMYQMVLIVVFVACYVQALRHYKRWLLMNFADLEHKEVWQSLVLMAVFVSVYAVYTTNGGSLLHEYLSQWLSIGIIVFVVWRTETLQTLTTQGEIVEEEEEGRSLILPCLEHGSASQNMVHRRYIFSISFVPLHHEA